MSLTVIDPTETADWQRHSACHDADPELFFPESSRDPAIDAKAICLRCPVRAECLDHALFHGEHIGVWGGLTAHERRQIRDGRRRLTLVSR